MSQGDKRSAQVLFREWRGGDAEAGGIMAQRFADWYYVISNATYEEIRIRRGDIVSAEELGPLPGDEEGS